MRCSDKPCANPHCASRYDSKGEHAYTNSSQALYCSAGCRQTAYRDRLRAQGIDPYAPRDTVSSTAPCPECGSAVERMGRGRIRVYCSVPCRDKAQTERDTGRASAMSALPEFIKWVAPKVGACVLASELYDYHVRWCKNRPFDALSRRALNAQLINLGCTARRTKHGVVLTFDRGHR